MLINLPTTQEDHRIAWLTAAAVLIHIFESAIPTVLPGLKPGLANIVVITVLVMYGWRTAAWVSILRVLVGSLMLGTFLSPTFMMSLSGALASVAMLWLASQLPGRGFSAIGFSLSVVSLFAPTCCLFLTPESGDCFRFCSPCRSYWE